MSPIVEMRPMRVRSVWISDVHLGTKGCRAEFLLDFLRSTETQYLYLVGDIIDVWNMKHGVYWPQKHNDVIRTILGKAKHNTEVIYVPGNHDELLRDYAGMSFGNVKTRSEAVHVAADGRRLLVLHGDEFDSVVKCSRALAMIGSRAYDLLLWLNRYVNYVRRRLGFPYWSLAAHVKHRVKNAVNYISNFERAVAHEVHKHRVDGLVCGHIDRAEITQINDVVYCNDGDWVESCTALVERFDGSLHLIHWGDHKETLKSLPARAPRDDDEEALGWVA